MTTEFDPKKSYLTLKAHEKMIAYASFRFRHDGQDAGREGVIKISSFHRPYGGGHLTLTFIVDTEDDEDLRHRLRDIFEKVTDESLRPELGNSFEKVVKVSLDTLAHMQNWYVQEIGIHFRTFEERANVLIEERLIPALESVLHFDFETMEWWPENQAQRPLSHKEIAEHPSVKQLFKKWFSLR
jgi:hypothetical protein